MPDDNSNSTSPGNRSWLERLSNLLTGEPRDREELVEVLRDAQQRNLLNLDALAMMEGVMQVTEMQVRDIMIPRSQMVVGDSDANPEELLPIVIESGHSRFPVVGDSRDEIEGILMAKDLLRFAANSDEEQRFDMREVMRPAYFVPESKPLDILLKEFKKNRNHMAIVVDEYGGVAGLVTIEDVLEQIVGEIDDEHDFDDDHYILQHQSGHCIIKALTPVEDFNEHFETDFSDEEYDTIGGIVMHEFGRLPERGESISIEGLLFEVMRADARRVHLLRVTRE
ncbi:MAG: CBS domain-containing protein [Gammaproteobacteria bacterium]|nr:MAG: CBS domain-containing protein [Gammaproteobacteria bacterium]